MKNCVGILRQDQSSSSTCKFCVVKAHKSKSQKHQMQTLVMSLKEQSFWNNEDNILLQMVKPQNAFHMTSLLQTVKFKCRQLRWFTQGHTLCIRSGLISYVMKNIFIKNVSSNNCQLNYFCKTL